MTLLEQASGMQLKALIDATIDGHLCQIRGETPRSAIGRTAHFERQTSAPHPTC